MIRNKKVLGISVLAVIVIAIVIGIAIFVTNKDGGKGGLTVFEVNGSKVVITGNGKNITLTNDEKSEFTRLIKKIVNENNTMKGDISEENYDFKIDFDNGYAAYILQDEKELLFEGDVKKIEEDDMTELNKYISKMK